MRRSDFGVNRDRAFGGPGGYPQQTCLDRQQWIRRIRVERALFIQKELETAGLSHGTITRLAQKLQGRTALCQRIVR